MTLNWRLKIFENLSPFELYDILKLRQDVFIIEQNCIYNDFDGYDAKALHLLGFANGVLAAYARIFAGGVKYPEASVGRVVVHPGFRKNNLGIELMKKSLEVCTQQFGNPPVRLEAQAYLICFYKKLGFEIEGEQYLVDGIPHIQMTRANSSTSL